MVERREKKQTFSSCYFDLSARVKLSESFLFMSFNRVVCVFYFVPLSISHSFIVRARVFVCVGCMFQNLLNVVSKTPLSMYVLRENEIAHYKFALANIMSNYCTSLPVQFHSCTFLKKGYIRSEPDLSPIIKSF